MSEPQSLLLEPRLQRSRSGRRDLRQQRGWIERTAQSSNQSESSPPEHVCLTHRRIKKSSDQASMEEERCVQNTGPLPLLSIDVLEASERGHMHPIITRWTMPLDESRYAGSDFSATIGRLVNVFSTTSPPFPLGLCSAAMADDVANVAGSVERANHPSGGSTQDPSVEQLACPWTVPLPGLQLKVPQVIQQVRIPTSTSSVSEKKR